MKRRKEIESSKDEIAAFLRRLPEEVVISGDHARNRLFINGEKVDINKSLKVCLAKITYDPYDAAKLE